MIFWVSEKGVVCAGVCMCVCACACAFGSWRSTDLYTYFNDLLVKFLLTGLGIYLLVGKFLVYLLLEEWEKRPPKRMKVNSKSKISLMWFCVSRDNKWKIILMISKFFSLIFLFFQIEETVYRNFAWFVFS